MWVCELFVYRRRMNSMKFIAAVPGSRGSQTTVPPQLIQFIHLSWCCLLYSFFGRPWNFRMNRNKQVTHSRDLFLMINTKNNWKQNLETEKKEKEETQTQKRRRRPSISSSLAALPLRPLELNEKYRKKVKENSEFPCISNKLHFIFITFFITPIFVLT